MNRIEAANRIFMAISEPDDLIERMKNAGACVGDILFIGALAKAVKILSVDLDPETGLAPCGCRSVAKVRKSQAPYSGYYVVCQNINCICHVGFDRDTNGVPTGYFKTEEDAKGAWNRAMGYREGEE